MLWQLSNNRWMIELSSILIKFIKNGRERERKREGEFDSRSGMLPYICVNICMYICANEWFTNNNFIFMTKTFRNAIIPMSSVRGIQTIQRYAEKHNCSSWFENFQKFRLVLFRLCQLIELNYGIYLLRTNSNFTRNILKSEETLQRYFTNRTELFQYFFFPEIWNLSPSYLFIHSFIRSANTLQNQFYWFV